MGKDFLTKKVIPGKPTEREVQNRDHPEEAWR
jgi:hypothetical protein